MLRAQIVLGAADGQTNAQLGRRLEITPSTARKWRRRFCAEAGVYQAIRAGRAGPGVFPAAVVAEAKAVACALPTTRGVPTSRWSLADLREELYRHHLVAESGRHHGLALAL